MFLNFVIQNGYPLLQICLYIFLPFYCVNIKLPQQSFQLYTSSVIPHPKVTPDGEIVILKSYKIVIMVFVRKLQDIYEAISVKHASHKWVSEATIHKTLSDSIYFSKG